MSERREVKEEDDIKLALLFQCTSCRSLVLSFLCTMQQFFPKCYSWFLIQPERAVIHTSEKAVLPKQISSFTLPRFFYFNSFEGEILVNNTNCGGVPDPYAVQGSQRTRQNTWLKSSCFHSIAGDGGRTNEETRHTLKKKKKIFAHPVSVTTGEVDLSQSVPINELTQERCMCGLGEEIHFSTQFCERQRQQDFRLITSDSFGILNACNYIYKEKLDEKA